MKAVKPYIIKPIKFKIFLFALVVGILLIGLFNNKTTIFAAENNRNLSTEKIYSNIGIDDNFDDSSVIVVLDRNVSGINKIHNNTLFSKISFSKIIDLTYVTHLSTIKDVSNFEQVLQINLLNPGKENVIETIEDISLINGVKYVGPNRFFEIEKTPNDPFFPETIATGGQWAHSNIQSENAWNFTIGNNNVRVGIIDTGVASHLDLNANVATGLDFVNMVDNEPGTLRNDPDGHGTHVAGIVGAIGNNETGVSGVNWNVTIVPMQVANNNGEIDSAACVRAINYARDIWTTNERISILSMSIGIYSEWPEIETAIRQYQGLFVCSTGNKNQDNDLVNQHHYPSFYASDMHTDPIENMIAVGRSDISDERPTNDNANWGARTITLFAPGQNILSTIPTHICEHNDRIFYDGTRLCEFSEGNRDILFNYVNLGTYTWDQLLNDFNTIFPHSPAYYVSSPHQANGYHFMRGSSMATPYVSGVAALLLSINSNLTTNQLRTAIINSVDIPNINGINPLEGLCVTNGRLNAYNAVKFVLENYSNTTYTLSNYSSSINTNKTIAAEDTYFDEKNGFYKLNVTYAKNYEFIISSSKVLNVILYDEDFNELNTNDLSSDNLKTHIIKNLSVGTYYLRTTYKNENDSGIINTKIVSRNTVYLNYNQNDILVNTYNGIDDYYYINTRGAGFYEFKLNGTNADGTTLLYPNGAITLYNDSNKMTPMEKFNLTGYLNSASTKSNENSMIVYLPRNGYFYIDVNISSDNLSSLFFEITSPKSQEIDLFDLSESSNQIVNIFSESTKGDYFERLNVRQTGEFTISTTYSGIKQEDILFVLTKLNYNSGSNIYSLDIISIELMNADNYSYTETLTLEDGTYYIGYFNKNDTSNFSVTFNRLVTQSGSDIIISDPDSSTLYGSEVRYNNGSYRGNTLTVGFTRFIYFDNILSIPSQSRLDYYLYSSDESIATISQYGTLLGLSSGTVKIMAVYKNNPSIVYTKEFTVLDNNRTDELIINISDTIYYAESGQLYGVQLNAINSPYPQNTLYNWDVVQSNYNMPISVWGIVSLNGPEVIIIEGRYKLDPTIVVRLTLTVT